MPGTQSSRHWTASFPVRSLYRRGVANPSSWALPIRGFEVSDIWLSGETYVILYGPKAERVQFRFGGEAHPLEADGTDTALDGGGAWVHGSRCYRSSNFVAGGWRLRTSLMTAISVSPDQQYESWEMSGPADLLLVCPPGGGDPRVTGNLPPPP